MVNKFFEEVIFIFCCKFANPIIQNILLASLFMSPIINGQLNMCYSNAFTSYEYQQNEDIFN